MKENWWITLPRAHWAPTCQNATFHLSDYSMLRQTDLKKKKMHMRAHTRTHTINSHPTNFEIQVREKEEEERSIFQVTCLISPFFFNPTTSVMQRSVSCHYCHCSVVWTAKHSLKIVIMKCICRGTWKNPKESSKEHSLAPVKHGDMW